MNIEELLRRAALVAKANNEMLREAEEKSRRAAEVIARSDAALAYAQKLTEVGRRPAKPKYS